YTALHHMIDGLKSLRKTLKLSSNPKRIEGYDISNIGSKHTVGGMVVFTDGVCDPSQYRRFKVRGEGANDPANMAEVIGRRFDHPEWGRPDVILLDGGKPQLSACLPKIGEGVRTIALAKRDEEIFIPGRPAPVRLPKNHPGLLLLQAVRDEAHRYSKGYHKVRRRMGHMESR
ncbi:excinuclease ABC subunit C, partial [Candidatus Altiarchaeota archaeon]